jgi:hypothetical protein
MRLREAKRYLLIASRYGYDKMSQIEREQVAMTEQSEPRRRAAQQYLAAVEVVKRCGAQNKVTNKGSFQTFYAPAGAWNHVVEESLRPPRNEKQASMGGAYRYAYEDEKGEWGYFILSQRVFGEGERYFIQRHKKGTIMAYETVEAITTTAHESRDDAEAVLEWYAKEFGLRATAETRLIMDSAVDVRAAAEREKNSQIGNDEEIDL